MFFRRAAVICLAAGAALTSSESTLSAQEYFGQNKVQYKNLDFQILRTEHFDIYFYPAAREGIDISARLAERWYARLERIFSYSLSSRQPLVLYGSHPDFEQTNVIQGQLGEGTGGVTEPLRRRIVLPLGGPIGDTDHVIGHELVHAFQFEMTTSPKAPAGQNGAERLPLWFIEGMAEYLSLGPVDPNTAMWMRDAAREVNGQMLPSIRDLNNPKYFPYRWGQAFWAYVGGRWGDDKIKPMLAIAAASGGDVDAAFERVLGITSKEFSADWQASIRSAYGPILETTMPSSEIGTLVIKGDKAAAQLNVGPTISPDGRLIAFLSSRSFFSIDLFIADAASGKILRQLTRTATDPHFSSIQFIYSAGAWNRDSTRIAIATIASGRPALAIFNATNGDKDREVRLPSLDEVFNPTWSPDGRTICFTGMSRGLTDLYLYDLNSSTLRPLTHDPYADLMPAWSPDGKRIAFATDRFTTHLDTLSVGAYRIALIDVATGAVEQARAFTDGKNINPQWAPDGASIYFVSDRDGIPNLYRLTLASGDLAQLTRVGTGLSGITNTSPTLSVSSSTGVAAFSVYQEGKYDIYRIDDAARRPDAALGPASMTAATLPPLDRKRSDVAQLLADSRLGLPPASAPNDVEAYRPTLSLEAVAQPTVAVGASRFGTAIGGGVVLQFGDMLGDHILATAVQLNSGFGGFGGGFDLKNTAAQVAYFNQARRWNWGVIGGQLPYLTGGFASGLGTVGNEPAQVEQTIIFRQTEQSAAGVVSYPFNRASRVEFQGGVSRISFDQIVQTTTFSLNTGQVLTDDTSTTRIASPLTLGTASAAYVHDTSNYGATSPVTGERYRLEVSPTAGSIDYVGLLADYRRYFMPVSFYTIAMRVMHYGRYGSGAEDRRLFPLYLGYPNLVRGYDVNTFDQNECVPSATSDCPIFDRLVGSRVLVGNLEFRFPLLRPLGASSRMYGPVPVEVALFADGGVAWNDVRQMTVNLLGIVEQPRAFSWHDGVSSAGVALRVNLFGFAVGEFDFTHPFQRPMRGWVFQFNLWPGF